MSLLYIKESYVYDIPGREMHCHTDGCGYWRGNNGDHSMLGRMNPMSMFKVNGQYCCFGCLEDTLWAIQDAIEKEEE